MLGCQRDRAGDSVLGSDSIAVGGAWACQSHSSNSDLARSQLLCGGPTYSPLDKSPASPCHDSGIVTRTQASWLHHSRTPGPEEPSLPSALEHQPRAAGCREGSCSRNALSTQLLRTQYSPAPRNQQDPRSTRLSYVLPLSPIHFTQFCEVAQKMHLF